ncbi:CDP-alcohol phosphatidyltransferase family protein [Novosphingobium sediminicola]|uniref:Phosphatidylglycerophosphate synthase n=1 Tax=Novosphingobium sediminicola TaxID=563162 RepID=A0A7W6CLF5_9SPHN|nr:CDP-alcohol phosphatidyltransferase family protein [Novosphingobium sediminicola]MBB3957630.1 phosphatidylglycerophosphate synthase [Novosphingobium sediminicola]
MNGTNASKLSDKRFNESLVAGYERRALLAIAPRLPLWVTPDRLTGFGVFGAFVVMSGYILSRWGMNWLWLSNFGLVLHWFGDSLDGTVARVRKIERPRYGFYLDQVIDTIGSLIISFGIGLCPAVRMDLSLLVLIVFFMLSIQVYVRNIVDREFHVAVGGLGPTEMRLGIFAMNIGILLFGYAPVAGLPFAASWLDIVMTLTCLGMLVLLVLEMRVHLKRLATEEANQPQ